MRIVLAALTLAAMLQTAPTAQAACAAPQLAVSPTTLVAGQPMTVIGTNFIKTCEGAAQEPLVARLILRQHDNTWDLGTITPAPDFSFTITRTAPSDLAIGATSLEAATDPPDAGALIAPVSLDVRAPRAIPNTSPSARFRWLVLGGIVALLAGLVIVSLARRHQSSP